MKGSFAIWLVLSCGLNSGCSWGSTLNFWMWNLESQQDLQRRCWKSIGQDFRHPGGWQAVCSDSRAGLVFNCSWYLLCSCFSAMASRLHSLNSWFGHYRYQCLSRCWWASYPWSPWHWRGRLKECQWPFVASQTIFVTPFKLQWPVLCGLWAL